MAASYPATINYTGQHIEELFLIPAVQKDLESYGFKVILTDDNAVNLTYLGSSDDSVYARKSKGWKGGEGSSILDVRVVCEQVKKEMALDLDKWIDRVQRKALQMEFDIDSLTGSQMEQVEAAIFMDSFKRGLYKLFWLGDKTKTHATSGTYLNGDTYTAGSEDLRYSAINGVWKALEDSQAGTDENSKAVKHVIDAADVTVTGLETDVAIKYFKIMYRKASKALKAEKANGNLRIYATDEMIENYEDSLQDANFAGAARTQLIEGIERMTWNGIPIIPMDLDDVIEADFDGTADHRAVLSTPENLFMLMSMGRGTNAKMWTDDNSEQRRSRINMEFNGGFILTKMITYVEGTTPVTP